MLTGCNNVAATARILILSWVAPTPSFTTALYTLLHFLCIIYLLYHPLGAVHIICKVGQVSIHSTPSCPQSSFVIFGWAMASSMNIEQPHWGKMSWSTFKIKHCHRRNVMSYRFKSLLKLFSLLWLFSEKNVEIVMIMVVGWNTETQRWNQR